jgi:hypothetical protein
MSNRLHEQGLPSAPGIARVRMRHVLWLKYTPNSSWCTRFGNGRLARLLALLMALQADLPPLDFSPMTGRGKRVYIAGIHRAMNRDYASLTATMARYRTLEATRRFQWAMNAFLLAGACVPLPLANGARMPSTADDVSAEMRKAAFRSVADLR